MADRRPAREPSDHDWYIEPAWSVSLLLQRERFDGEVWDPACGVGTIPLACGRFGIEARGSDLVDRDYGDVLDFLGPHSRDADNIITNPPYHSAVPFIARGLIHARQKLAVLVPLNFLCSAERYDLFTGHARPTTVYFLSSRPSMPPGALYVAGEVQARGGSVDYCWIVWARGATPTAPQWLIRG